MKVPNWLEQRAASHRDHPALIGAFGAVTYGELHARAAAAAALLHERGARSGAPVGVLLPNGLAFAVTLHALMRCGAVLVPLGTRLTAAELAAQLSQASVCLLVTDGRRPGLEAELAAHGWHGTLLDAARPDDCAHAVGPALPINLEAPHCVVFTSGSSGRPKGVVLTYANHLWSAFASAANLGIHAGDRWLSSLPPSHVGGLSVLLRSVVYGTTAVLHDGFEPAAANRAIDEQRVTIVSVVANMLQRMLAERGARPYPSWLRCVLLGGGPAPRALLELCAERGIPLAPTYGLTEGASQVATRVPSSAPFPAGAVGKALLGTELRIAGAPVGEILVRGPTVSPGYTGSTEPPTDAEGWLHTGDLGYLGEDGELHVVGRADDTIISGGENVHPAEVEAALESHPAVLEACAFGIPDERWGEVLHARVRLTPGASVEAEELRAHVRSRLAGYKVPRAIEVVEDFPRTASGKIVRPARQ